MIDECYLRVASLSECKRYRYGLTHYWGAEPGEQKESEFCVFVGLNPSTADAFADDPTVKRCVGFARRWGFLGFVIVNAFGFRATEPANMLRAEDPIGPENDEALLREPVRRFLVHRCYQWFDFESVLCLKDGIDWVVIEPELPNARPMNPNWVRDVISACKRWQIPVFFRGWGDLLPAIQYRPKNDIAPFSEWTVTRSDGQPMRVGAIPDLRNYVIVMREDSGRKLNGNEYLETPN